MTEEFKGKIQFNVILGEFKLERRYFDNRRQSGYFFTHD